MLTAWAWTEPFSTVSSGSTHDPSLSVEMLSKRVARAWFAKRSRFPYVLVHGPEIVTTLGDGHKSKKVSFAETRGSLVEELEEKLKWAASTVDTHRPLAVRPHLKIDFNAAAIKR